MIIMEESNFKFLSKNLQIVFSKILEQYQFFSKFLRNGNYFEFE